MVTHVRATKSAHSAAGVGLYERLITALCAVEMPNTKMRKQYQAVNVLLVLELHYCYILACQ